MQLPRELLEAVDEVLKSKDSGVPPSARPDVTARLTVALECWLHGSATTDQAIALLRSQKSPSSR
jgi:hypothetical protein